MMPDVFAFALLAWFIVCAVVVRREILRLEGMLVLIAGWLASVAAQGLSGDLLPLSVFAFVDVAIVLWFLAFTAHRTTYSHWIGVVILAHGLMLIGHAVQHFSGWPTPFLYMTYLNALGYISAGAIAGGFIVEFVRDRLAVFRADGAPASARRANRVHGDTDCSAIKRKVSQR
jgi:hypothetical protein